MSGDALHRTTSTSRSTAAVFAAPAFTPSPTVRSLSSLFPPRPRSEPPFCFPSVLPAGWPSPTAYPCIAGHEVIGTVVRAGDKVKNVSVGDRVGVGAQGGACLECEWCVQGLEQHCDKGMKGTYQVRRCFPLLSSLSLLLR